MQRCNPSSMFMIMMGMRTSCFYTRVKLKPSMCSIYNEHTHTQREDLQNETCTNLYYDQQMQGVDQGITNRCFMLAPSCNLCGSNKRQVCETVCFFTQTRWFVLFRLCNTFIFLNMLVTCYYLLLTFANFFLTF